MIKRRAAAADLPPSTCCHTFRATGITTHLTNGCYRLHPVEWNIGESAGLLVSFCLDRGLLPRKVHTDVARTRDFQQCLRNQGIAGWRRR